MLANYSFSLQQTPTFLNSSNNLNTLKISFPPEISLAQASCSACQINLNSNSVLITLTSSIQSNNSVYFTIYNIQNAASYSPPSKNISVLSQLNNIYNYSLGSAPDNYQTTINNIPSSISLNNAAVFSSLELGAFNNISLLINGDSFQVSYYVLSLSPQFDISYSSCSTDINLVCQFNSSNRLFIITKPSNVSLSTISISIQNIINPIFYNGTYLSNQLQGYSISNYLVNSYNGTLLQWQPKCNLPCRTCTSILSTCLSCYNNLNITNQIYYDPTKMICLSACYSNQILIGTVCTDCTNNCMQCSLTLSNCTSCNTSTQYAYYYNFTCLSAASCPIYHYASTSFNCLKCPYPCLTCTSPTGACLSCVNGTFLYLQSCLTVCTSDITIPNLINNTCDICDAVCKTCSVGVSNCTSCAA